MDSWAPWLTDLLWRNALAAIPLAVLVAAVCRWSRCRPATRHALWLALLVWLVIPPILPRPDWTAATEVAVEAETPADAHSAPPAGAASPDEDALVSQPESGRDSPGTSHARSTAPAARTGGDPAAPTVARAPGSWYYNRNRTPARAEASVPDRLAPAPDPARLAPPAENAYVRRPPPARVPTALPRPSLGSAKNAPPAPDVRERICDQSHEDGGAGATVGGATDPAHPGEPAQSASTPVTPGTGRCQTTEPRSDKEPSVAAGPQTDVMSPDVSGLAIVAGSVHDVVTSAASWGRRWLAGVIRVRDAIGRLPPLPAAVWLSGIGLMTLAAMWRAWRFRRRVRPAVTAPKWIKAEVRRACRTIGLGRMPEVLVLGERVSPMIWHPLLARRTKLILPTHLWSQLDEVGRKAVLFHELAHLRRRDHWVRRAELLVAALYWWHPVVWWVRHRLHEEAELCCDAWVTWLLPRFRRAYAEALLVTKRFAAEPNLTGPTVGIGITTGRARRFARRLTMVMTQSIAPRTSVPGLALVMVLAAAGWLATPAESCPPKEKVVTESVTAPAAMLAGDMSPLDLRGDSEDTFTAHITSNRRSGAVGGRSPRAPRDARAPRASRAQRAARGTDSLERRLDKLEQQMERLAAQLGKLNDGLEPGCASGGHALPHKCSEPCAPVPPGRPLGIGGGTAVPAPGLFVTDAGSASATLAVPARPAPTVPFGVAADVGTYAAAPQLLATLGPGVAYGLGSGQGKITRKYWLSEGKLKTLTALMSRSDVPILIRPLDDGIEVQGTAAEQAVFAAFVGLLDGKEEARTYRLPEGKLKALTELMIRSDVPVMVEPLKDGLKVHGTKAVHDIVEAFVWMLEPGKGKELGSAGGGGWTHGGQAAYADALRAAEKEAQAAAQEGRHREIARLQERARGRVAELSTAATVRARLLAEQMSHRAEELAHQVEMLEAQSEHLEQQAEWLADQAEELLEKADELREQAAERAGDARAKIMDNVSEITDRARKLQQQAQELYTQARTPELKARVLEEEADRLADEAESLHERAESAEG